MDGSRPPDKRNAAYESIFGRPSASHHQTQHPSMYPQSHHPPPSQPYIYQSSYQGQADRRTSYTPSYRSNHQPFIPHQPYGQPSYTPNAYAHPPAQLYPSHAPYNPSAPPPLAPQSMKTRGPSINSSSFSPGVIVPQPEEPPDPSLESLTRTGLTPAQAYQAQIINPNFRAHPSTNSRLSVTQNMERLSLGFENESPDLGIDFDESSRSAGVENDDDSSELPWARSDQDSIAHDSRSSHQGPPPPLRIHQDRAPGAIYRNSEASESSPHQSVLSYRSNAADTAPSSSRSSVFCTSPSTLDQHHIPSGRRSSESARTMPRVAGPRREKTAQDRSMSMSATSTSVRTLLDSNRSSRPPIPPLHEGRGSPISTRVTHRKAPIVYPALLSRVAEAFRERIPLSDRVKDGLTYKNVFDGREAVDKIAYIIKTTDRNLALLLGRALDAQKFFHDVTYDHRLRDSASELYQFRTVLPSPFVSGELGNGSPGDKNGSPSDMKPNSSLDGSITTHDSLSTGNNSLTPSPVGSSRAKVPTTPGEEVLLPSGVFTLLADCYSPTCSRDQLCYSIACPRRLEQQARLNMKPQPGLSKQISKESLGDAPDDGTLWIHSVPQEIVNSVSEKEKKRQEAINEVIYTERDFVRDMEYLRDCWINRLVDQDIIPQHKRTDFLEQVFWNIHDIIAVNTRLRDALTKRQKSYAVVERIGDIFLDIVPHFGPFVSYGAHQLYGKYEFEKEKNSNPAFAQFVETTERLPESRKLELNAYLTKPTTRLARYPLLLEAVLKHTPDDSPDKTILPQVVTFIREFLGKVNTESGKTENRFNLVQLDQQLVFRPGEEVDLRLSEEGRELIYKGTLNKRDGEINVYLFDHALLLAKPTKGKQGEQLKVYRRPVPLELLLIFASEDAMNTMKSQPRHRVLTNHSSLAGKAPVGPQIPVLPLKPDAKGQNWITFVHLGRKYYQITLWASTVLSQRKWLENITKQQLSMRERSTIFETVTLSHGFFSGPNQVNCAVPFNGGRKVVYGTDDGVYLSDLREPNRDPVKVLGLLEVTQVDVLEDYQLLIVLSERQVMTFPLDALDPMDPMAGLKRAKRISSHTSFFKAGFCLGKVLVCVVKSSQLSSTFKTLEPIDQNIRGRSKPTFKKLLQGGNDTLKLFREFYIPVESTSIHYLRTRMCVGCSRGFEIVDLESLDTQGLLDPSDESLDFVRRKENIKPMAIYRIANEFLLCYDEFAFYVNKNGQRSRKEFMIHWEGTPTGFALHEPYVLAFEPSFVEIRHIDTGLMSQVIQGNNLRLLFADTPPSVTNGGGLYNHNPVMPGYDFNPYVQSPSMYGSRTTLNNGYGLSPVPSGQSVVHPSMYSRNPQGVGRDEILMVSDDRVLALRTVFSQQQRNGDGISIR